MHHTTELQVARPVLAKGKVAPRDERLQFLDALRGYAALIVMQMHMTFVPSPALGHPDWMQNLIEFGGSGVPLFFIISGFTLARSLSIDGNPNWIQPKFYWRRIFRIVPLFYVMVAVYVMRDHAFFNTEHSAGEILLNLFFLYNFVPKECTSIVWAGWTLGVEMIVYLAFPLFFKAFNNLEKASALVVAAFIAAFYFDNYARASYPTGSYAECNLIVNFPAFAVGLLSFQVYQRVTVPLLIKPFLSAILLVSSVTAFYGLWHGWLPTFLHGNNWPQLLFAFMLAGLAIYPWEILVNRVSVFFGKISYSVYLLHPFVIWMLFPVYPLIYKLNLGILPSWLTCLGLTLLCVTLGAFTTYTFIEQPCIAWGRDWIRHRYGQAHARSE